RWPLLVLPQCPIDSISAPSDPPPTVIGPFAFNAAPGDCTIFGGGGGQVGVVSNPPFGASGLSLLGTVGDLSIDNSASIVVTHGTVKFWNSGTQGAGNPLQGVTLMSLLVFLPAGAQLEAGLQGGIIVQGGTYYPSGATLGMSRTGPAMVSSLFGFKNLN